MVKNSSYWYFDLNYILNFVKYFGDVSNIYRFCHKDHPLQMTLEKFSQDFLTSSKSINVLDIPQHLIKVKT